MKKRVTIDKLFVLWLLLTETSCRYVEQCRYFDATGGCDLLFSQTAKHEGLTFTGNRTTHLSRRRTQYRTGVRQARQQILNQLLLIIAMRTASMRGMKSSSWQP